MDIKFIKAVYRFLKDTDIVEFELEGSEGRLRIRRKEEKNTQVLEPPAPKPRPSEEARPAASEEPDQKAPPCGEHIKTITSPMVGTFYRAPSPEAQPFVEVGTHVKPGQVLCIIEAMKLMNEVESDTAGKIVSILVENGQPVEYGEPLFYIDTKG